MAALGASPIEIRHRSAFGTASQHSLHPQLGAVTAADYGYGPNPVSEVGILMSASAPAPYEGPPPFERAQRSVTS